MCQTSRKVDDPELMEALNLADGLVGSPVSSPATLTPSPSPRGRGE
ncbi:MAG TPA: hypothetical protein VGG06_22115 [Thermoanaerobaculia bacterium]